MINGRMFNVDLTMTENCNLRCSYCFEEGMFKPNNFKKSDLFIKRINEILDSSYFIFNFEILGIYFWGGEPTLNSEVLFDIFNAFKDNDKVIFMIYSNGYSIDNIIAFFEEYASVSIKDVWAKIHIQISFDGQPIHDICRRTKNKKPTANKIKNTIRDIHRKGISTSIKSTINLEQFQYLPDARRDVLDLHNEFSDKYSEQNKRYNPSINYYTVEDYNKEDIEHYSKVLTESLIQISRDEIEYFKEFNQFYFSWFNNNNSKCSAGRDLICVDIDGKIYNCHGTIYDENKKDHLITSLHDDEMIENIQRTHDFHLKDFRYEPDECKNCEAHFCLKCNHIKYKLSKKDKYIDRWRDYADQPNLCHFYKLNGKIVKAAKIIIKENKNGMSRSFK